MKKAEIIRRQIEKKVYEKFPVTKGEIECANERRIMNQLRYNYRKKLEIEFNNEKVEYK
jgi:translation initiation factor IF-1